MTSFVQKILAVDRALDEAEVPHAFGGALALGYCVGEPRATIDIDVNVFVVPEQADLVLGALPAGVKVVAADRKLAKRDGQVRVFWEETPIDLFFGYHAFHEHAAGRARAVPLADTMIPVLDCTDLVVFKAFFARSKDWVDIEAMAEAGTIDRAQALGWVGRLLGPDHPSFERLAAIVG